MITYLGWSLLGISEDLDPLKAADFPSESLARILYAGFLIMGVILLVNMLIALLSNTYQRIKVRKYTESRGWCKDKKGKKTGLHPAGYFMKFHEILFWENAL